LRVERFGEEIRKKRKQKRKEEKREPLSHSIGREPKKANLEIHPAKDAGWRRVGVPGTQEHGLKPMLQGVTRGYIL
jgi:hypothetical protein